MGTKRFLAFPHTPGPWHVGAGLQVCDTSGHLVARCSATRGKFELEEPNAYLIATAPELLEMLEKIHEAEFGFGCWPTSDEIVAMIAKAKGGAA